MERGLATVDYDFLEASKHMSEMLPLATLGALVEAETKAKRSRAGIWKILHEQEERQKAIERKRWLAQALAEAQLPKIEIKETINTVKSKIEASAPDTSKILQTAKDTLQGSLSKAQEKMSTLSKDLSPLLTKLPEEISKVNIKDKLSQLTKHLPSPEDVRNSTQSLAQKLPNSPIFDKSKIKELISSKLKKKQE